MLSVWSDRTVIVTGASSGIGRRVAELLVDGGARVIALDRNPPPQRVAEFVKVDLAEQASIDAAVDALGARAVHGLCNIAGVAGTTGDELVYRVNYLGLRHLTSRVLPLMPPGSSIVNLSSMAGSLWRDRAPMLWELAHIDDWQQAEAWIRAHPVMFDQTYRKFKEALNVWMLAKANDLARRQGVRMNCVSPGPVETPILDDFLQLFGQRNFTDIVERTGRAATPDDIAPTVLFLLSDDARWIVGVDLPVEGGLTSSRFVNEMEQAV